MSHPIKVLIVDDSAVVRQGLTSILSYYPDIAVIGSATDPYAAAAKISLLKPDVILLDVEMPRMDGITFLKKLMTQHPIPVIICSSLVGEGSDTQIRALEYGAIDIVAKPTRGTSQFIQSAQETIANAVRAASKAKISKLKLAKHVHVVQPKQNADAILPQRKQKAMLKTTEKVVVIGASTGGTQAITKVLQGMPADCPPIVIVQHMPEGFTRSFASRLNDICAINVKEAKAGDTLLRGHALIAPGNLHMLVQRSGARYFVSLKNGPLVSRHRPSVDVLFRSAAQVLGRNGIGVIMTGMGDDGARGLLEMRETGAYTLGQNEESCVVYGMPKEALKLNATQVECALDKVASKILTLAST